MTFWISQGKVATPNMSGGQISKYSCQICSGFNIKNYYKRLIFDRVIQKIKTGTF